MTTLQKFLYKTQIIMLLFIPLWVAIGRGLFDAGGWYVLVTLFVLGPILFVGLLLTLVLTRFRKDIKSNQSLPILDTALLSTVYIGSLLFGFFIEDGGDTKESVGSAASKLFNIPSYEALNYLAIISMALALISLLVLIAHSIYKLIKK